MTEINLDSIIGTPKIIATINAIGSWEATDCYLDPYGDVIKALKLFPETDNIDMAYLILNEKNNLSLNRISEARIPFWEEIMGLFRASPGVYTTALKPILRPYHIKVLNKVPDNTVLVVSDNLNVVAINIEPNFRG